MPLKIVRNDITKMDCDAVVNTANEYPAVGYGCDIAIYNAAGYDRLLSYRKEHIGRRKEGEVFLTPGFDLPARYIIHAVSPAYHGGSRGEEKKLRSCYQKSLELARMKNLQSIAFPLIATGSYHYPKEDGMRIAVDEINAFLLHHSMLIYLVVYDDKAAALGKQIYPDLRSYIDRVFDTETAAERGTLLSDYYRRREDTGRLSAPKALSGAHEAMPQMQFENAASLSSAPHDFYDGHESKLAERMRHLEDTFSEYLLYLIKSKGMTNADVYRRAIVDKKVFSKIKNDRNAHPQKMTAMCLCIGAQLNIDETRDLLARAGYALSPSNKTDVIFSYFIENEIYDMIQLDIELEEYGEKCLIS